MPQSPRKILIIGATSSLAQVLCRTLAARGHTLILSSRNEQELELLTQDIQIRSGAACHCLTIDLTAGDFSPNALIMRAGDFDDLIITIGDMGNGEQNDVANLASVTHINYTLPAQIATVAVEHLRNKQSGSIVIISSVAGDRGRQSNYAYGSAKAALSTFASGLRNRYYKDGVHVMTVKPGFVDTPMTWGMHSPLIASREYVAEKIVQAMEKKKDVVYVPFFWRFIMLIIIHIPEKVFKRLKL